MIYRESAEGDGGDGQFEGSGLIQAMQKIFGEYWINAVWIYCIPLSPGQ